MKGAKGKYRTVDTDRPIGQNHKRNLIRAVKAAFRWAEEEEYIERSPLRGVKVPAAVPRGDDAYLLPEQWIQLIAAVKDLVLLDVLTTLKETGCRPQEARAVESRHFDRVGRCWQFPKAESVTGRIKTSHERAKLEQPGLMGFIIATIPTIDKRLWWGRCRYWACSLTVS